MREIREECGIFGVHDAQDASALTALGLHALQHRGQEAWGLAIPNKAPLKRLGLVSGSSGEFKKITEELLQTFLDFRI